jgi:hypothetical protein
VRVAWRLRPRTLDGREILIAAGVAIGTALIAYAGMQKLGTVGLLAPLALGLVVVLLLRPVAMTVCVVGLVIVCEGSVFGLFHFTSALYSHATVLNVMVALVAVSVGLDMMRRPRRARLPASLKIALAMLALAMVVGVATAHDAGVAVGKALHSENLLAYLLVLPAVVANLELDRRRVKLVLGGAFGLAIVKAMLGLMEVFGGYGSTIEGSSKLSYYEPTANWLIMIAVLGVFAALVSGVRPPLWMLLGTPLLIASLVLSYRRSFWIAAVLGLLLVVLLALSPTRRRILVPVGLLVVAAIWLLGSINFQSQSPLVRRFASLAPSSLTTNLEDRYRLDERANVLGEIRANPITGLGIGVPWAAAFRPLAVEHVEGRQYVHFVALWFWLKLGILGLIAYLMLLFGGAVTAWRVWRTSHEPMLRAFGLASLCGFAGLTVIETTASFTGVDARFTVLLGAQLGLLVLLARADRGAHPASRAFEQALSPQPSRV